MNLALIGFNGLEIGLQGKIGEQILELTIKSAIRAIRSSETIIVILGKRHQPIKASRVLQNIRNIALAQFLSKTLIVPIAGLGIRILWLQGGITMDAVLGKRISSAVGRKPNEISLPSNHPFQIADGLPRQIDTAVGMALLIVVKRIALKAILTEPLAYATRTRKQLKDNASRLFISHKKPLLRLQTIKKESPNGLSLQPMHLITITARNSEIGGDKTARDKLIAITMQ